MKKVKRNTIFDIFAGLVKIKNMMEKTNENTSKMYVKY